MRKMVSPIGADQTTGDHTPKMHDNFGVWSVESKYQAKTIVCSCLGQGDAASPPNPLDDGEKLFERALVQVALADKR